MSLVRSFQSTLQALGVIAFFSRPAVSNDNPYSESLFKTLKYRHDNALSPFENLLGARHSVTDLVHWYNEDHRPAILSFSRQNNGTAIKMSLF